VFPKGAICAPYGNGCVAWEIFVFPGKINCAPEGEMVICP